MVAKYYFYDNYFDLPGALLCGRVVDMLHKVICNSSIFHFNNLEFDVVIFKCYFMFCHQRGNEVNSDFWKDMIAAIDHNYNTSAFKGTLSFHTCTY